MPVISGFHALTYDPAIDLTQVVTPPYDVIDATRRAALARRHPYNFVQIDLPAALPGTDRYRAASEILARWRADNILQRDTHPVLYRYDQEFTDPELGRTVIRRGVLAAVELSPWSARVVRPHEATLAGPREDRARLLAATRAHLSPVFAAYEDPEGGSEALLATCAGAAARSATTDDGTLHKLWRIGNPETIARWAALLRDKWLYVLDGHHRYETMVGSHAPHGLMFMIAMTEPGLVVLPTHRVVHGPGDVDRERFLADTAHDCDIELRPGAARDAAALRGALAAGADRAAFAAVFPHSRDVYLLTVHQRHAHDPLTPAVSLLHELIVPRALAASGNPQAATPNLQFISNTTTVLEQIARGEGRLALLMRPPSLDQIRRVADAGRVMPQKSTYFFPKLASGLVVMPIDERGAASDFRESQLEP